MLIDYKKYRQRTNSMKTDCSDDIIVTLYNIMEDHLCCDVKTVQHAEDEKNRKDLHNHSKFGAVISD